MDKELWKKCQLAVDTGNGHIVKDLYLNEFETKLTPTEFDLSLLLDSLMASSSAPSGTEMKKQIEWYIDKCKRGKILAQ